MDSPQVDILRKWQSYLTNISSNLMELTAQTEYQLIKLKTVDREKGYTGMTKARAEVCINAVDRLWRYYALLAEVVEKAVSLRGRKGLLYNPEEDIRKLLEDTPIVIEREHVDISQRNLLGEETIEKRSMPVELLKYMEKTFENICRDVDEITRAEESIRTRLNNLKNDITKLKAAAKGLCIEGIPSFDMEKETKIQKDPLQGEAELDKLVYNIEKYRAGVKTLENEYRENYEKLKRIREMLSKLRDLSSKSRKASIESKQLFGNEAETKPVIGEEILKSLEDWLYVLEKRLAEGGIKAVRVGALRLEKECLQKLEEERKNYDINIRNYKEWIDLKGQFDALVAKMEVLRNKGLPINDSIDDIKEKTNAALHAKPINIGNCRKLVEKLELSF